MAAPLSGSWNAFQCANLGYGQILRPLQREQPNSVLVLDGASSPFSSRNPDTADES